LAALGGEQIARHAIALWSRDIPGHRFGSRRCVAIPARSLRLLVRAGVQPPARSSLAREEARSPRAPQMRDTGRTTASLMAETSLVACRPPFGTVSFPQPATYPPRPRHPHSPYLPRSPPRTIAAHLGLPTPGDPVRTMELGQIHPNAACASSSQLLPQVLRRSLERKQYTALAFGGRCREAGVRPSMGSVGDAYD